MLAVAVGVLTVLGLALANAHFRSPGPAHTEPPPAAAVAPLVVGDGRTVTLVNLGGAASDAVLGQVSADIGQAVAQVEGFWGTDWSAAGDRKITVMATATDAEFAAATAGSQEVSPDLAAVTVADAVDPARRQVSGQAIVLSPGASRMGAEALRIVLTHELFHYASRADTAADAPRWLTEGVADYVARPATDATAQQTAQQTAGQALPTALPSDADFAAAGPQLSDAYDRAWSFARFVADRYGVVGLRTLYQRACGVGHPDFAVALQQAIGIAPTQALAEWRDWLAGHR